MTDELEREPQEETDTRLVVDNQNPRHDPVPSPDHNERALSHIVPSKMGLPLTAKRATSGATGADAEAGKPVPVRRPDEAGTSAAEMKPRG